MSGYTNTAIALGLIGLAAFVVVAPLCHNVHAWHRRRVSAGLRSLEPSHLLIIGLAGIILSATFALGGVLWQGYSQKQTTTNPGFQGEVGFKGAPIGFASFGWAETGSEPYRMGRPVVTAKNVSEFEVHLKSLVMVSGNSGQRLETKLRTKSNEWIDASETEMIPPNAEFQIQGTLPPHGQPVQVHSAAWMYTPEEIVKDWTNIYIHVECDEKKYDVGLKEEISKAMDTFFEMRRKMTPPPPPPGISKKS